MFYIQILLCIIGVILLLYLLVPRGNLLHELLHLPVYHYHLLQNRTGPIPFTRYKFGTHQRQYFLHFPPLAGQPEKNQVIVFFHGGGWSLGTPEMFAINAAFFTRRGYHVFMPSYRRIPLFRYPQIREDLNEGFLKIRSVMAEEGIFNKKIIAAGMSAGGNLAALLAYDRVTLNEMKTDPNIFVGILLLAAPLDLSRMQATPVRWSYAGRVGEEMFAKASPISYLQEEETLPVLAIHGTRDGLVAFESAQVFMDRLKEKQRENYKFHVLENGTHLDTGSWNFFDNKLRQLIVNWLEELESDN